jgi:PAS domain S-box-containing protein/diguanylate cyclase (GGDEF)-like protein
MEPPESKLHSANPLRILLLEDNPDDERLCVRVLQRVYPNLHLDVVRTRDDFISQLRTAPFDVVLSDFALGGWTGLDAFHLLREGNVDIPFILVTGALGEEKAVECVKNGMTDYILKDSLERLPIAISRAVEETNVRREHQRAERLLRESEEKFRTLADAIPAAIFIEQADRCCYVNQAAEEATGYSRGELLTMNFSQLVHPDSIDDVNQHRTKLLERNLPISRYEIKLLPKQSRNVRWLDVAAGTFLLNGQIASLTTALDVTERKRAERDTVNPRDPVTGVASRQRLVEIFDSEAIRTDRTGRPFSLLLLVLLGVKQIIGRHGQLVANRALNRFSRTMTLHCRSLDILGRIGADSFAFVLPETPGEGALVLGRRIVTRLGNDTEEPQLSCVFGRATYPDNGKTLDELLNIMARQAEAMGASGNVLPGE